MTTDSGRAATTSNRLIAGEGTPADRWQSSFEWLATPVAGIAGLVPVGQRLVVVAPHPDDEVLCAGGLLAAAVDAGREHLVVAVTDGEASHPDSRQWPTGLLAAKRREESLDALRILGVEAHQLQRLGFADGHITADETRLATVLSAIIRPGDIVVSPWQFDGHPDHEAVARACRIAAASPGISVLEAPIWGLHWADPRDDRVPWRQAVAFGLAEPLQELKHLAVQAFQSQVSPDTSTGKEPILPAWALARLMTDRELFFR